MHFLLNSRFNFVFSFRILYLTFNLLPLWVSCIRFHCPQHHTLNKNDKTLTRVSYLRKNEYNAVFSSRDVGNTNRTVQVSSICSIINLLTTHIIFIRTKGTKYCFLRTTKFGERGSRSCNSSTFIFYSYSSATRKSIIAQQGKGPSPMVMERFQGVASQLMSQVVELFKLCFFPYVTNYRG